jgi:uncharacterized membrane protein HdeD (DUF308 family)
MSTGNSNDSAKQFKHELIEFKKHWWWFLVLGILLVICGIVAVSYPFVSSVSVVIVIAATLIVGGVAMVISAFWTGKWSAFLVQVLVGILYIAIGMMMTDAPLQTTAVLTMFVAALLIVVGSFRIVAALAIRFPQWGWAALNGVVTVILGLIIYRHFPESSLLVIGVLVGIEMILNGFSWIMLAVDLRNTDMTSGNGVPLVSSSGI